MGGSRDPLWGDLKSHENDSKVSKAPHLILKEIKNQKVECTTHILVLFHGFQVLLHRGSLGHHVLDHWMQPFEEIPRLRWEASTHLIDR